MAPHGLDRISGYEGGFNIVLHQSEGDQVSFSARLLLLAPFSKLLDISLLHRFSLASIHGPSLAAPSAEDRVNALLPSIDRKLSILDRQFGALLHGAVLWCTLIVANKGLVYTVMHDYRYKNAQRRRAR